LVFWDYSDKSIRHRPCFQDHILVKTEASEEVGPCLAEKSTGKSLGHDQPRLVIASDTLWGMNGR
jgi:hypothetical protein